MPNWSEILSEIQKLSDDRHRATIGVLDEIRRRHLRQLADYTNRNTIAYYSAFLSKPGIEGIDIVDDDKNAFMNCIHGLDRSRGLDLILHTPGGHISATESIVYYLKSMFGNDIRAIIPQIAMSAGTMIACACKTIIMGKQSNIGPIDPQIQGIPADVVKLEFERAYKEIKEDPIKAHVWSPILNRYPPSFIMQCEYAVEWAKKFVIDALRDSMFCEQDDAQKRAVEVANQLSSAQLNKAHSKHLHIQEAREIGLIVEELERDQNLQEYVLTVHHCFIHTTTNTACLKIVENQDGRAMVRQVSQQIGLPGTVRVDR